MKAVKITWFFLGLVSFTSTISTTFGHLFSQGHSHSHGGNDLMEFQLEPRRIVTHARNTINVHGHSAVPLLNCTFVLPNKQVLDFHMGPKSRRSKNWCYHGHGLHVGDCGLALFSYHPEIVGWEGLIESRIRTIRNDTWETSATTVRVSRQAAKNLPVFNITPKTASLQSGANITILCNTKQAIDVCQFYLPDGRNLTFDLGPKSHSTPEYRYHGAGLGSGECGVTLSKVKESLSGYVVCKVGRKPDLDDGAWNTDAMRVLTSLSPGPAAPSAVTTPRPQIPGTNMPAGMGPVPATATPGMTISNPVAPGPNSECGKVSPRETNIIRLINFGMETYQGQWPWHTALYRQMSRGRNFTYACGGTLISLRAMVTAGHCIAVENRAVNATVLKVFAGKYYLEESEYEAGLQERRVQRVVLHPGYNRSDTLLNDVAIVFLETPLEFTAYVKPVCLWDANNTGLSSVVGRDGIVVGWGYDDGGQLTPELMMASMPVVTHETCIRNSPQQLSVSARPSSYCAGFRNGTSACNGDSGGGMVFATQRGVDQIWFLRGLVSSSLVKDNTLVCDTTNYVIFTDLAQFVDWISTNNV